LKHTRTRETIHRTNLDQDHCFFIPGESEASVSEIDQDHGQGYFEGKDSAVVLFFKLHPNAYEMTGSIKDNVLELRVEGSSECEVLISALEFFVKALKKGPA
jgi:hypothetical protein